MNTRLLMIALTLGTLAAAAAAAQPGPWGRGAGLWEDLAADFDKDQDGRITLDELAGAAATFRHLDRDEDGVLTEADFERGRGPRDSGMRGHRMGQRGHGPFGPMGGGPLARRADADADGAISSAEWQAFVGRLDADGDGEIVFEEWHAAGPGDREPRPERFEMILRHFDANDDGVLETADFDALFAELDADASGAIEADELPRHHFRHRRG